MSETSSAKLLLKINSYGQNWTNQIAVHERGPPISARLYQERFESIKNGTYQQKYLETVYIEKQKLLLKLETLEQFEAVLKAEIQ